MSGGGVRTVWRALHSPPPTPRDNDPHVCSKPGKHFYSIEFTKNVHKILLLPFFSFVLLGQDVVCSQQSVSCQRSRVVLRHIIANTDERIK